ncbi:endonuclease/Exonuclease/phosphatase family domain-containing protein [Phthorimaea operculella]|nr:endonuclease/Exonuclease/phosphatase family domain-containing protein [Phthorimaea operculella]
MVSYNCKSMKRSIAYLRDLCKSADIIALQETWLLPHDLDLVHTIDTEFSCTATSSVDTSAGVLRGRPYGGLAILWRKSMFPNVSVIKSASERINAIRISLDSREVLVVNCYMPTDDVLNLPEFTSCLGMISAVVEESGIHAAYLLGDYNSHPTANFGRELTSFCKDQDWCLADIEILGFESGTFTFSLRADCMIALPGWAVCAAGEVRSRQHAFKVYHTGTAFYFAADTRDAMQAWLQLLTRATVAHTDNQVDGKFGSLKKLTSRMARSESHEAVAGGGAGSGGAGGGHAAASLDRKCLRFFSRHRGKDDHKNKNKTIIGVPVPTEHVRTYRRVLEPSSPRLCVEPAMERTGSKKLLLSRPHASNPNLAENSNSEWHRRGGGVAGGGLASAKSGRKLQTDFLGSMTLEEFMLQKQEEERRQVYTNRVLMGVERTTANANNASSQTARAAQKELQKQLEKIIPDGFAPRARSRAASHGAAHATHLQGNLYQLKAGKKL